MKVSNPYLLSVAMTGQTFPTNYKYQSRAKALEAFRKSQNVLTRGVDLFAVKADGTVRLLKHWGYGDKKTAARVNPKLIHVIDDSMRAYVTRDGKLVVGRRSVAPDDVVQVPGWGKMTGHGYVHAWLTKGQGLSEDEKVAARKYLARKNPRKRSGRSADGSPRMKGPGNAAKAKYKMASSVRRGQFRKAPGQTWPGRWRPDRPGVEDLERSTLEQLGYGKDKRNPRKVKAEYLVKIPRTKYDTGYDLTVTAVSVVDAKKQARAYCAKQYAKITGLKQQSYRLPSGTTVKKVKV